MKAKVIAKLVTAGHQDLAEQLMQSMGNRRGPARIEDGEVKLPMYRGFDDRSPKRAVAARNPETDKAEQAWKAFELAVGQYAKGVLPAKDFIRQLDEVRREVDSIAWNREEGPHPRHRSRFSLVNDARSLALEQQKKMGEMAKKIKKLTPLWDRIF
jgi:hypothetical protein